MNSTSSASVTNVSQSINPSADTSSVVEILGGVSIIVIVIAIIVFVLWVLSLIAIIEISTTLKQMREDALRKNLPEDSTNESSKKRVVEPLKEEEVNDIGKTWLTKKRAMSRTTILLLAVFCVAAILLVILSIWLT